MGRPGEGGPDDGPVAAFAAELRALRVRQGSPSYPEIVARGGGPNVGAVAAILDGKRFPTWEETRALLAACGEDPEPWRERWERANAQQAGAAVPPVVAPETNPWWRRYLRTLVAAGAVVVLAAAFLIWSPFGNDDPAAGGCGDSGLSQVAGECVGVTDGRDNQFDPALTTVMDMIYAENQRVTAAGDYVSLALLNPMSSSTTATPGLMTTDQVRHALEGAYTGQWRANHTQDYFGDPTPRIKLLLANEGSHEEHWQRVTEQIVGLTTGPDHLVGVVGLGFSVENTRRGAKYLSSHGIAMVSALTSADELNNKDIPGFIRISPSNTDYVTALSRYLTKHRDLKKALIVSDNNDDRGDLYARSLAADFKTLEGLLEFSDPQPFRGVSIPGNERKELFSTVTSNVCGFGVDVVLYAGREIDLHAFLESLSGRTCKQKKLVVMTGVSNLGAVEKQDGPKLGAGNINIVYATATDPHGWPVEVTGTPPGYGEFSAQFVDLGFDKADLLTAEAPMTHDAVVTAVRAARLDTPTDSAELPSFSDVRDRLFNLNGPAAAVRGATGTLTFSLSDSQPGRPRGKPVPVLVLPVGAAQDTGTPYLTGEIG